MENKLKYYANRKTVKNQINKKKREVKHKKMEMPTTRNS